jgi:hypothetical protein
MASKTGVPFAIGEGEADVGTVLGFDGGLLGCR